MQYEQSSFFSNGAFTLFPSLHPHTIASPLRRHIHADPFTTLSFRSLDCPTAFCTSCMNSEHVRRLRTACHSRIALCTNGCWIRSDSSNENGEESESCDAGKFLFLVEGRRGCVRIHSAFFSFSRVRFSPPYFVRNMMMTLNIRKVNARRYSRDSQDSHFLLVRV